MTSTGICGFARQVIGVLALCILAAPALAQTQTLCTLVTDASDGAVLYEAGDCAARVTPASTFKIPLALMGFDAGFLVDSESPALPFRQGYPDWGGAPWRQTTTPTHWMTHSVVWYSQQIAQALGVSQLTDYAMQLNYGNADFAGDPGQDNALERAWISSSLAVSPREQVAFLANLVNRRLPASAAAQESTIALVGGTARPDGWTIFGKTGSAYPRRADFSFDRARGWGWFVGWATNGPRTVIFARLAQDNGQVPGSTGLRARDALFAEWPSISASF